MQDIRFDFPRWLQKSFFVGGIPPNERAKLLDEVEHQAHLTVQTLGGRLVLPKVIKVGFEDFAHHIGQAKHFNRIILSGEFVQNTVASSRGLDDLRYLLGHEMSHLSDFTMRNRRKMLGFHNLNVGHIVSEGKAESVAVKTGSSGQLRKHPEDKKLHLYNAVLAKDFISARLLGNVDSYAFGYTLVKDVIEITGVEDIFDIHPENTEFYVNAIRDYVAQESIATA